MKNLIALYKTTEFLAIFILLPVLFLIKFLPIYLIIPATWVVSLYILLVLNKDSHRMLFDRVDTKELFFILKRFFLFAIIISFIMYQFYNQKFLYFAIENTKIYLLVIVLYPLLSVIPQELIFRKFFFFRYGMFFTPYVLILLNALVFSFVHLVFKNYIALVLTFVGGILFITTYIKTKSFSLVCIEHALYGDLLFTVGLGEYFYHGNVA